MEGTSPALVFLAFRHMTEDFLSATVKKGLRTFVQQQFAETASDKSFNTAKYIGSICHAISSGLPIMITDAHELISRKGQLTLPYDITARLGKIPYKFVFVEDEKPETDGEWALKKWTDLNCEVISVKQFADYVLPTAEQRLVVADAKVTCGLCTMHVQNEAEVTGHATRRFGITSHEADVENENNAVHIGKVYKGEIIGLTVDGKPGGSIVMIPELGATSHITNNTTIRSVLSGPVLEKYNNGIMEFTLKDIDENAKQNPNLKLDKIGDTDVHITGWYTYCVQK